MGHGVLDYIRPGEMKCFACGCISNAAGCSSLVAQWEAVLYVGCRVYRVRWKREVPVALCCVTFVVAIVFKYKKSCLLSIMVRLCSRDVGLAWYGAMPIRKA